MFPYQVGIKWYLVANLISISLIISKIGCLFPPGPGVLETLYVPFKGEVSVFPSSVEFLQSNPDVLQNQILWGLLLLLSDPLAGKTKVGLRTSLLWQNFCGIIVFQFVGCPPSRYGILFYCDFAPPTISLWFLLCLWM